MYYLGSFLVAFAHFHRVYVGFSRGYFLPQSKVMQIGVRLIGDSRLTVAVTGCLSLLLMPQCHDVYASHQHHSGVWKRWPHFGLKRWKRWHIGFRLVLNLSRLDFQRRRQNMVNSYCRYQLHLIVGPGKRIPPSSLLFFLIHSFSCKDDIHFHVCVMF